MNKIEIDFNNLKYNLYEILNISSDSDEKKIKKHFTKVIKTFHPDKNSDLEEDIYYHIILANQILLNPITRKKYDDFLITKTESFSDLKKSFNKSIENINQYFPEKENSNEIFKNKLYELNKKHGYDEGSSNELIIDKFKKIKSSRESNDIGVDKQDINTVSEFNDIFLLNKTTNKFKNQLIPYNELPYELSTYVHGENYTSLADIDKLYIEDSIQTTKYSSLDRAFMLQSIVDTNSVNKSFDERMKEYTTNSDQFKNMKPTDFIIKTGKQFSE